MESSYRAVRSASGIVRFVLRHVHPPVLWRVL